MRRSCSPLSLALLGAGVFLMVLAPLLTWYVEPRSLRTPIDTESTTVFEGRGSYFDQEELRTQDDARLTITRRVLGNVAASERDGVAVWDVSQTIDHPGTLKLRDPRRSYQWKVERWVTDRETNLPVHCCEEAPGRFGGEAYLKFPFGVEERDYTWWDSTLGGAVPLRYEGRREVGGHQGLRFTGSVEETRVGTRQVPAVLVDAGSGQTQAEEWYSNSGIDLTVDQRTGRLLDVRTAPKLVLRASGGSTDEATLLHSEDMAFTEDTVDEQVALARADNERLQLLGVTAPLTALVLGVLLSLAGGALVVRGRPAAPVRDDGPGDTAARAGA